MPNTQKIAATYDQIGPAFSSTRPKLSTEAISLLPQLQPQASVLDLGCGNGVLLTALPEVIDYTGLDISPVLLTEAQKSHPKAKFIQADINQADAWQGLGQYNFIAALAVFHHILDPKKQFNLLSQIKAHLKPNGTVLISVWNLNRSKFDLFRTGSKTFSIPFHGGPKRDFYAFDQDELPALAKQAGFSRLETTTDKNNLYLNLNHP